MKSKVIVVMINVTENTNIVYYVVDKSRCKVIEREKNHIIIKNENRITDLSYCTSDNRNLSVIYNSYLVKDIIEIYDWGDHLDEKAAEAKQNEVNCVYKDLLSSYCVKGDHILVTIIEKTELPKKYLVPVDFYKTNMKKGNQSTNHLLKLIHPYKLTTSYYFIFKTFNLYIVKHIVIKN